MTNPDFSRPATDNTEETMSSAEQINNPAIEESYRPKNFQLTENTDANPKYPGLNRGLPRRLRSISQAVKKHEINAPQIMHDGFINTLTKAKQRVTELGNQHSQNLDNAALAVINGEDPMKHLARYTAWNQTFGSLTERVEEIARANYLQAVNDNADHITRQIGEKLFFPALAELIALIEEHPGKQWSLDAAVNAKDFAHAALIEANAHIANKLHDACQLRALLYTPEAFTDEAAYMTLPGFKGNFATDNLQWWVQILDQGHSLWFPTANEWHTATHGEEFSEYRKAEAEALAELNAEAETELGADKPAPYEPARSLAKSAY